MESFSPVLLEVNTRVWLRQLSEQAGQRVELSDVPDSELDRWRDQGFTHVWLMGVWQVGARARALALREWREKWRTQFPASTEENVQGSPYAIAEYSVDSRLGRPIDLLLLKERFARRGLRLILDFVPNHVGIDSSEPRRYPARFVQAPGAVAGVFAEETKVGRRYLAHGKDPYFSPWIDTVQVDYRVAEAQEAMSSIAQTISMFGDGLRCDMAMLVLPEVFAETWKAFPSVGQHQTRANFWRSVIPRIRQLQPHVEMIAEAYWDKEQELQDAGFDYTYNKRVTDFIMRGQTAELAEFLYSRDLGFLRRSVHFLENHDEARAASVLSLAKHQAAAGLMLFLPGMALIHAGQLEGRKVHVPIQMNHLPPEAPDPAVQRFYQDLMAAVRDSHIRRGRPELVRIAPDLIAVRWVARNGEVDLGLVNLNPEPIRGQLGLVSGAAAGHEVFVPRYSTQGALAFAANGEVTVPGESAHIVRCPSEQA